MLITRVGPLVPLNDALRDAHESLREQIAEQIEKRKAKNIPLDDSTDFGAVRGLLGKADTACAEMDGEAVRDLAGQVVAMTSGGLVQLDEFVPDPEYDGISIAMRAVKERRHIEVREALAGCRSTSERHDVFAGYVAHAVAEVSGLYDEQGALPIKPEDGSDTLSAEQMELLDAAGLVNVLWSAARHYAELPASKKKHFGSRALSDSQSSTVPHAADRHGGASDVTAAPAAYTDSRSATPTPAPGATS